MKTRHLIKKYKNKSKIKSIKNIKSNRKNRKSIKNRKIKNKSRKRILKGGVPHRGVIIKSSMPSNRTSRTSSKPIGVSKRSSISSRPSDRTSDCCSDVAVVNRTKIIGSINSFPFNFQEFYNALISEPDNTLAYKISSLKPHIIQATTIQPQGAYLSINGLKFVNYLRSKYNQASEVDREKIENIISLFDQHAMSQGVRDSDLEVIKTQLNSRDFDCYKNLYKVIYEKLFNYKHGDDYPVSVSAIPLYCQPRFKPKFEPIVEEPRGMVDSRNDE